jgi:hypothetical protein
VSDREKPVFNVLQMYVAHGGPGFWVRRTTWGAICARVIRVGALTAPAPYFGNPSVLMDAYTLDGELREGLAQSQFPAHTRLGGRLSRLHGLP